MNKYIPPDFKPIQKANAGDSAAMQKLFAPYNTYIMFFAKYNGVVNYSIYRPLPERYEAVPLNDDHSARGGGQ